MTLSKTLLGMMQKQWSLSENGPHSPFFGLEIQSFIKLQAGLGAATDGQRHFCAVVEGSELDTMSTKADITGIVHGACHVIIHSTINLPWTSKYELRGTQKMPYTTLARQIIRPAKGIDLIGSALKLTL